jgi:hypothetical protein
VSAAAENRKPLKPSAFSARVRLSRTCGDIGQVMSAPPISRGGEKRFLKNLSIASLDKDNSSKDFFERSNWRRKAPARKL